MKMAYSLGLPVFWLGGSAPLLADGRVSQAAAGCVVCNLSVIFLLVMMALDSALLVWVARDAKARGMDGAGLWLLLVFFTSLIGLILYLLGRPQGNTVFCKNCRHEYLQASATCPHCDFSS